MVRSLIRIAAMVVGVLAVVAVVQPDLIRRVARHEAPEVAARCDIPIRYSLGAIDGRFGLDRPEVRQALTEAVGMWESVTEASLFRLTPGEGMRVAMVFDERQSRARARQRARSELGKSRDELDATREAFQDKQAELKDDWDDFEQRRRAYEKRQREHERAVQAWQKGDVERTKQRRDELNATAEQLKAQAKELERRQDELEQRRRRLEREREAFENQVETFNERVQAHQEEAERLTGFQMGRYEREGADRRIEVFKALNGDELRLVLAHELGHSLGIEHVNAGDAVMNERLGPNNRGRETISPVDRRALAEVCDIAVNDD